MPTTLTVTPHPIAVSQEQLDDLQRRLELARWPAEIDGAGADYGTDQAFLRTVIDRWANGYDWRRTEAELNGWGSFTTVAAGQRVHFLHTRSADPDAIPLVLTHGWPGSIVEFLDALPMLTDRFHLVVVSMPGYGFSGPTSERGVDVARVAAAVADVMAQLGYDRYVAQGGDWGALVTRYLGEHFTPNVVAIHTNMLFALPPEGAPDAMEGVTEVHDLHIWTITSGFPALSAHVLVGQGEDCHARRRELAAMLDHDFGIGHSTLQVEHGGGRGRLLEVTPRSDPSDT